MAVKILKIKSDCGEKSPEYLGHPGKLTATSAQPSGVESRTNTRVLVCSDLVYSCFLHFLRILDIAIHYLRNQPCFA